MAFDYTDRRKHERVDIVRAIFIEVVNKGGRSEADNPIIRCETVDVSVGGLKIFVTEEIVKGSRLNLAVPLDDWKENLELVGEAMWIKPAEGKPGYWVGLELKDSSREDMEKWFKVVHTLSG